MKEIPVDHRLLDGKNYLSIRLFAERYDIVLETARIYIANNKDKGTRVIEDSIYIDERFFLNRKKLEKKVWLEAHDMYYYILDNYMTDNTLKFARVLHAINDKYSIASWNMFMQDKLFRLPPTSMFDYKINGRLWSFYRICRSIMIKERVTNV